HRLDAERRGGPAPGARNPSSAVRGSGPRGEGEPLGKAGARGRGPLQGGHGGWPAAATCLSPVPGRQEGGRMRDTGTGDERRGRGGGTRTRSSSDRKSTRLNSSHGSISYAVFCLK